MMARAVTPSTRAVPMTSPAAKLMTVFLENCGALVSARVGVVEGSEEKWVEMIPIGVVLGVGEVTSPILTFLE